MWRVGFGWLWCWRGLFVVVRLGYWMVVVWLCVFVRGDGAGVWEAWRHCALGFY
jgi:hypothetical protein